ncbi:MAG: DUF4236 domain-containing protein [Candidatus Omnitrophica bacterium]|nr:DUF4236 domain-containing protein [Candidatus Omnitrophota bacterium]MCG2707346.1 DUF4236 domain-containing protein [Candidatus Omnitrophota bacterium]
MGFYLRKSLNVGPLRFNLSKSGIGVSTGIKGFRIGAGPRGNYIRMGGGCIYYRKTWSSESGESQQIRYETRIPKEEVVKKDELNEIESGSVFNMVDSSSAELLKEFNSKLQKVSIGPITFIGAIVLFISSTNFFKPGQLPSWVPIITLIFGAVAIVLAFYYDEMSKSIVLFYEGDDGVNKAYQTFHDAFDKLMQCAKVFHIEARGDARDWKRNAGASYLVRRKIIFLNKGNPPYVKTNISIPIIPVGRQILYFFPDRLLVVEKGAVGAVDYKLLKIDIRPTRFIEDETVPIDAKIVDHTWRFVNKNGEPDRRFNNNRELPILLYEEVHFTSESELNEVMQLSRLDVTQEFKEAIQKLTGDK